MLCYVHRATPVCTVNCTYFKQFVNYCVCILVYFGVLSIVYCVFCVLLLKLKLCPELGLSAIHCVPLSLHNLDAA